MTRRLKTRGFHYAQADRLLAVFGPDDNAYSADIPNLLRALAHAVLATALDDGGAESAAWARVDRASP